MYPSPLRHHPDSPRIKSISLENIFILFFIGFFLLLLENIF